MGPHCVCVVILAASGDVHLARKYNYWDCYFEHIYKILRGCVDNWVFFNQCQIHTDNWRQTVFKHAQNGVIDIVFEEQWHFYDKLVYMKLNTGKFEPFQNYDSRLIIITCKLDVAAGAK